MNDTLSFGNYSQKDILERQYSLARGLLGEERLVVLFPGDIVDVCKIIATQSETKSEEKN
ncbi:MAG: hypothetical protein ABIB79_05545 [archaeon]